MNNQKTKKKKEPLFSKGLHLYLGCRREGVRKACTQILNIEELQDFERDMKYTLDGG